jgi:hypothetical protein
MGILTKMPKLIGLDGKTIKEVNKSKKPSITVTEVKVFPCKDYFSENCKIEVISVKKGEYI